MGADKRTTGTPEKRALLHKSLVPAVEAMEKASRRSASSLPKESWTMKRRRGNTQSSYLWVRPLGRARARSFLGGFIPCLLPPTVISAVTKESCSCFDKSLETCPPPHLCPSLSKLNLWGKRASCKVLQSSLGPQQTPSQGEDLVETRAWGFLWTNLGILGFPAIPKNK